MSSLAVHVHIPVLPMSVAAHSANHFPNIRNYFYSNTSAALHVPAMEQGWPSQLVDMQGLGCSRLQLIS